MLFRYSGVPSFRAVSVIRGDPGFWCVPGCSGVAGCSSVFRGVPSFRAVPALWGVPECSGVPGFSTSPYALRITWI